MTYNEEQEMCDLSDVVGGFVDATIKTVGMAIGLITIAFWSIMMGAWQDGQHPTVLAYIILIILTAVTLKIISVFD